MRPAILFLCLLALTACNYSKHKSDITGIELIISDSLSSSELTTIQIDSSLNYKFYGGWLANKANKQLKGYYNKKISRALWDTLTDNLQQIDYEKLNKTYKPISASNAQELELIVHSGDKIRHIKAENLPRQKSAIFYEMTKSIMK